MIAERTMRKKRLKISGRCAVYHCVTRTVNKERLIDDVAKEVLRKQLWQIADFSGVEVITYCVMSSHFHVQIRVPDRERMKVSDQELMRRYRVLYPRPTPYQQADAKVLEMKLLENGEGFLDVFSGTGTISFTEKTQPEYLFRTLLPQCVSIMARLP